MQSLQKKKIHRHTLIKQSDHLLEKLNDNSWFIEQGKVDEEVLAHVLDLEKLFSPLFIAVQKTQLQRLTFFQKLRDLSGICACGEIKAREVSRICSVYTHLSDTCNALYLTLKQGETRGKKIDLRSIHCFFISIVSALAIMDNFYRLN